MPLQLPDHATEASRRRAELAERLAQSCPPDLADEIALVGSTARGYADEDSDLELNLWAETIPALEMRIAWLSEMGAREVHAETTPRPDDSYWIYGSVGGIPVEVGWQKFAAAEALIKTAALSDRNLPEVAHLSGGKVPVLIELIVSAIPLRTSGRLAEWKASLSQYSDALQRRVIEQATERWSKAEHVASMRRLARRGERLALTEALLGDLDEALHVLYAAKRRWEPSAKWRLTVAREFAPFELDTRIDAVLGDPALERRVGLCAQLCLDVLALVPEAYDVSTAVEALRAGLT